MMSREIDDILIHDKNPKLKVEAVFVRARSKLRGSKSGTPDLKLVEEFLKLAPKDPRGATLLEIALNRSRSEQARSALGDRLAKEFPDSSYSVKLREPRDPDQSIGQPFKLEFADAITSKPISMAKLKGKVVVVDFWATWCGPCVAEMPKMKELYAKYRDHGVEFIGVSLDQPKDQGGLDKLKTFVKENEIAWPQYYQGNGWQSEFSKSWKINSIPRVFVVDPERQALLGRCPRQARNDHPRIARGPGRIGRRPLSRTGDKKMRNRNGRLSAWLSFIERQEALLRRAESLMERLEQRRGSD